MADAVSISLMSLDRVCLPADLPENVILTRAASSAASVSGESAIPSIGCIWLMYYVLVQTVCHALLLIIMVDDAPSNHDCLKWEFQ